MPEEVEQPAEKKRRGRKKETVAEDPSKPAKKRGRPKKKPPPEDVDELVLSSEPEPPPCAPEKKQKKETKPRGRGKKKAPYPEPPTVEPSPPPETTNVLQTEQTPLGDTETSKDGKSGASTKKRKKGEPPRRKTYVVADAQVLEDDNPDGCPVKAEPNLDLTEMSRLLGDTVIKAPPKPTLRRKRPVPRMSQSPRLVDSEMAQSPETVQGSGAKSPKKARKAIFQGSPSPVQIEVAQAMEQPISGVPFLKLFESICFEDSREAAREMFRMLIHPVSEEHFLS